MGLFSFFPVFAMDYPIIAGITISEQTTAAEYIVYFFNLSVGIGAFIAVIVVVLAGIDWMTAGDNSSKITSAKGRIKNTLFGIAILMGCYLMLDAINPSLKNIKIDTLSCTDGIKVSVKDDKNKVSDVCVSESTGDIAYDILATKNWYISKDVVDRVWIYSDPNFGGKPTAVSYGGSINGAKAIYFETKKQGAYLYNDKGFTLSSGIPFFVSGNIPNMVDYNYDNKANSLKFIDPPNTTLSESVFHHAIVFEDPNYRGKCSFSGGSVTDLGVPQGGYYPSPIGNNALSSLVFFKIYGDESKNGQGTIQFFSASNCGGKTCTAKISSNPTPKPISESSNCGTELAGEDVMSFKITGSFGLVLISDSGKCQYWGLNDIKRGTCFSKLVGEDIFTAVTCGIPGISNIVCDRPKSFMAFPVDEK